MENMDNIAMLFKGDNLVPTLIVAAAAFLVGIILGVIVAKIFSSSKKSNANFGKKNVKGEFQKFEKRHPAPADGSIEIYVGNLSYDLTEDILRKEFEAYGKVNSARIITNRYNNKSKGFGFVHMPNKDEAAAAVKALSDKEILGRKLKCNEAKNVI